MIVYPMKQGGHEFFPGDVVLITTTPLVFGLVLGPSVRTRNDGVARSSVPLALRFLPGGHVDETHGHPAESSAGHPLRGAGAPPIMTSNLRGDRARYHHLWYLDPGEYNRIATWEETQTPEHWREIILASLEQLWT